MALYLFSTKHAVVGDAGSALTQYFPVLALYLFSTKHIVVCCVFCDVVMLCTATFVGRLLEGLLDLFLWLQRYMVGPYSVAITIMLTLISGNAVEFVEHSVAILFILEIDDVLMNVCFTGAVRETFEEKMKIRQSKTLITERSLLRNVSVILVFTWMCVFIIVKVISDCTVAGSDTTTEGTLILCACLGFGLPQVCAKWLVVNPPAEGTVDGSENEETPVLKLQLLKYTWEFAVIWPAFLMPIIVLAFVMDGRVGVLTPGNKMTNETIAFFAVYEFASVFIIYHLGSLFGNICCLSLDLYNFGTNFKYISLVESLLSMTSFLALCVCDAAAIHLCYFVENRISFTASDRMFYPNLDALKGGNIFYPYVKLVHDNRAVYYDASSRGAFWGPLHKTTFNTCVVLWCIGTVFGILYKWISKKIFHAEMTIDQILYRTLNRVTCDIVYLVLFIIFLSYVAFTPFESLYQKVADQILAAENLH